MRGRQESPEPSTVGHATKNENVIKCLAILICQKISERVTPGDKAQLETSPEKHKHAPYSPHQTVRVFEQHTKSIETSKTEQRSEISFETLRRISNIRFTYAASRAYMTTRSRLPLPYTPHESGTLSPPISGGSCSSSTPPPRWPGSCPRTWRGP